MPHERSAGAVIYFRTKTGIDFLVLQYYQRHWDFPRGHVEEGETDEVTAIREIREETGLVNLKFIPGFKEQISWWYHRKDEPKPLFKEAVYFLAEADELTVQLSEEHSAFKWLSYNDALQQLTFLNARNVLKKAEEFLAAYEKK